MSGDEPGVGIAALRRGKEPLSEDNRSAHLWLADGGIWR
jgi:hypothetical protein